MTATTTQQNETNLILAIAADLTDFAPFEAQIGEWERKAAAISVATASDQKRETKIARESRLGLREVRVAIEHKRKDLKEESLAHGRKIDSVAKALTSRIEPIEAQLREQEEHFVRIEAARLASLRGERETVLRSLDVHPAAWPASVEAMSDEDWTACVTTFTAARDARVEAERRAEEQRVADAENARLAAEAKRADDARLEAERVERERVQAEENARLRREAAEREEAQRVELARLAAEAAAKEAELRAERKRAADERLAAEETARQEREAIEAKAELDAAVERERVTEERRVERQRAEEEQRKRDNETREARRIADEKATAERTAREKAEREAQELRDAEAARIAREAESKKPTRAKYAATIAALHAIAAWDDAIEDADEPHAATRARKVLTEIGEAPVKAVAA